MHLSKGEYRKLLDHSVRGAEESDRKRFWQRVTKGRGCWLYKPMSANGYGQFTVHGKRHPAHRVSLLWAVGVPKHMLMMACHLCRNRNCVRPEHLYFGSATENMRDRVRDGTHLAGSSHPMAKIDEKTARQVIELINQSNFSSTAVAEKLGIARCIVKNILTGRTWQALEGGTIKRGLLGVKKYYGPRGHPNSTLNESDVLEIRRSLADGVPTKDLALQYGVKVSHISHIKTRRAWSHLPDEQGGNLTARPQRNRLSKADVAQIKKVLLAEKGRYGVGAELARKYNASPSIISGIKKGRVYADVDPAI